MGNCTIETAKNCCPLWNGLVWFGLEQNNNIILFLTRFSDFKNKIKSWKNSFFEDNFGNWRHFGVTFFFWSEINEKPISGVRFWGFYTKTGEKLKSYFYCRNELTGFDGVWGCSNFVRRLSLHICLIYLCPQLSLAVPSRSIFWGARTFWAICHSANYTINFEKYLDLVWLILKCQSFVITNSKEPN